MQHDCCHGDDSSSGHLQGLGRPLRLNANKIHLKKGGGVKVVINWGKTKPPHHWTYVLDPAGTFWSESGSDIKSYHRASLCSTSLRKPVWNLCRGSKVEKTVFFRESGVASSCPTALWKDWDHKYTHTCVRVQAVKGCIKQDTILVYIKDPLQTLENNNLNLIWFSTKKVQLLM